MYFHHYLFDGFQNGIGCYFGMSDLSVHVHRSMRRATIPTYPSLTLPRQVNSWHHIFFLYLSASRLLKKVTSQNCLPIGGFSFRQFGRFFVLFFAYSISTFSLTLKGFNIAQESCTPTIQIKMFLIRSLQKLRVISFLIGLLDILRR